MQEDEIGSQELLPPGATNTFLNWKKDKVKDNVKIRPSILVIKINKTRPSILCVTHQMMNYKRYLMVLGQYMTILAGTWSV